MDDFLDRDKLVFNICSNKGNNFDRQTLDLYYEISQAAYCSQEIGATMAESITTNSDNFAYWRQLHAKFKAIHAEIQDASKSVNKNFGKGDIILIKQ